MLHALLLLPLLGCTGMPDLAGLFGDDAPVAAAPVAPPPKDTAAQVADIRGLLRAGKAAEAAKAAEALLAAHPEDDAVWELVEVAAIRGGVAAELVDRLSADKAIGGRADRHHVLRGVLAVEAARLGDAITAARALRTVAPGDAAALFALAIARGAPAPSDLTDGERGLVALADPTVPLSPAAEALPGWRAALVRADARLARGDRAGAAIEAFIAAMRGQTNVVALYHFARSVPRGTARGTILLNGAVSQGASSIVVDGISPSPGTILAGDVLGVGGQLLMAAADATASGGGATITLVNRVRTALSDNAAVTWNAPTALFRMLSTTGVSYFRARATGPSFTFGEYIA